MANGGEALVVVVSCGRTGVVFIDTLDAPTSAEPHGAYARVKAQVVGQELGDNLLEPLAQRGSAACGVDLVGLVDGKRVEGLPLAC